MVLDSEHNDELWDLYNKNADIFWSNERLHEILCETFANNIYADQVISMRNEIMDKFSIIPS